jgi:hypothetical protein
MDSAIENLFPRFLANLCLVGQLRSLHPFAGVVHHQQEEQHAEEPVAAVALISPSFLTALSLVDERQRGAVFKALGKLRLDVSVNYVLRRLDAAVDPAAVGEQGGLLANANSARQRLQMVEKRLLTEAGELKTKKERRPGVYDTVEGAIGEPIAACVSCFSVTPPPYYIRVFYRQLVAATLVGA